eukprot:scaffold308495_cov17-Prasinocladus_malaysianus.AAC.1
MGEMAIGSDSPRCIKSARVSEKMSTFPVRDCPLLCRCSTNTVPRGRDNSMPAIHFALVTPESIRLS